MRARHQHIAINTKGLIADSTMTCCQAGQHIFGLDVDLMLNPCILLGNRCAVDLKESGNRSPDAIAAIRKAMKDQLRRPVGTALCLGNPIANDE